MPKIIHLYKITNTVNNKLYIGQSVDCVRRWYEHKRQAGQVKPYSILAAAIKKYGNEVFTFEVIACCLTYEDAEIVEAQLIEQYQSLTIQHGYNIKPGGKTSSHSKESLAKMSASLKAYYQTDKGKAWIAAQTPLKSERLKGRIMNDEWIAKIAITKIGNTYRKGKKLNRPGKTKLSLEQIISIINDPRSSNVVALDYPNITSRGIRKYRLNRHKYVSTLTTK